MISLLDENEDSIAPKFKGPLPIYKSPLAKPPGKVSNFSKISTQSRQNSQNPQKKKYKKDEHALMMAWRSRTSSPCPSSNSIKSGNYSISSNLSFKEKKKLLNAGAVKHPSIFTMKRVSSLTNSVVSDISSKGSMIDSIVSINFSNKHEMKRSSSGMPKFRKI